MCYSKSFCSCVESLDHCCPCFTQFLVHNTVHNCKICIFTTHFFIAFIAAFATSSQATSDVHTTTLLWPPSFHFISQNTKMAREKKEMKHHFSSNPHYGMKISPIPNDLQARGDRQMLNTQLLDCLPSAFRTTNE